jgi:hypothetical protein
MMKDQREVKHEVKGKVIPARFYRRSTGIEKHLGRQSTPMPPSRL